MDIILLLFLGPLGYHYCTTSFNHLYDSTMPELRFSTGSNPALGVSEIRDGEVL